MPPRPESVVIDGVRYVPVSEAHIGVAAIEDAVVGQWAGDNWRTEYPDAPGYLRVVVGDDDEGEGETVTEFVARLLAGLDAKAGA
jgi:hypothetical protein